VKRKYVQDGRPGARLAVIAEGILQGKKGPRKRPQLGGEDLNTQGTERERSLACKNLRDGSRGKGPGKDSSPSSSKRNKAIPRPAGKESTILFRLHLGAKKKRPANLDT